MRLSLKQSYNRRIKSLSKLKKGAAVPTVKHILITTDARDDAAAKNLQSKRLLKLSKVQALLQLHKSIRTILSLKPKVVRLQVMK